MGRNRDFFTQNNERLELEGLKFLWDSPDSCKRITQIVLKSALPLPLAKVIKKEAVLKPETHVASGPGIQPHWIANADLGY